MEEAQQQPQPKKVLGQYFLKNTTAIMQSINALRLKVGESVIEIGPGTGALTGPLAKQCAAANCELIAVEKDEALASQLKLGHPIRIITGDILIELPKLAASLKKYKIIGNIPYYITGHLLRVIGELENKPATTVSMIQKEVAQRLCVDAGEMNLLAAATQVWATPKLLLALKPNDFEPAPTVHSAVIQLTTNEKQPTAGKLKNYYAALHRIFKQPRKMLINNLIAPLSPGVPGKELARGEAEKILTELSIDLASRPQNLSIIKLMELGERCK